MSTMTDANGFMTTPAAEAGAVAVRVKHLVGDWGLVVIFAVVFVYLSLTAPAFLDIGNLTNIVLQSSIVGVVALGMTFVMITGGIDLSVGSVLGISAVMSSLTAVSSGVPALLSVAIGLVVGAVVGLINATMIALGAIMPFLATLATMAIARTAALLVTDGQPTSGLNADFQWIGSGKIGPVPVPVILFILIAFIADFVLSRTVFGQHVYAVGGNDESAQKVGISVQRIKIAVYIISGLMSALAGIVLAARVNGADPLAGTGNELQAIAAVVIGGTSLFGGIGSIRGTVLGVLLLGVAANGLNLLNVSSYYQQGIQGLIIVLAVLLNRWKSD